VKFSHLAATRRGVVIPAHVQVKSRLRPASRVRSASPLPSPHLTSCTRPDTLVRGLTHLAAVLTAVSERCIAATVRSRAPPLSETHAAAARPRSAFASHCRLHPRAAMVRSSVRAGEASTVSPSIASFGHATELPAQQRRRRARSRKGQAHAAQARAKLGQAMATCTLRSWATADSAHWPLICFAISCIYSNQCKFKNLYKIHLNSKNYETNFAG
jgi:hypothetical protein